jgi:putative FmdB family regulatory protein
MPLYEYLCDDCEYIQDVIHPMNESPLTKCPKCGGRFARILQTGAVNVKKGLSDMKTLGDYALKKREKMSADEIAKKEAETRFTKNGGYIPRNDN